MSWLQIIRLVLLTFTSVCAVIVLGIAGDLTSTTEKYLDGYFAFAVLGIATAVLTMLTIPAMIIIDFLRTGIFTSMIVVELSWLTVVWILWLATGATAANSLSTFFGTCDFFNDIIQKSCHESQAIEAFSWIAWISLLVYTVLLLTMCIIKRNSGHKVWFSSVKEGFAPSEQYTEERKAGTLGTPAAQPEVQYQYPPRSQVAEPGVEPINPGTQV